MPGRIWAHFKRHRWFYLALVIGAAAWRASGDLTLHERLAVAGDTFYFAYLCLIGSLVVRLPAESYRERCNEEDEGVSFIMLITLSAVTISFISIFSLLNAHHKVSDLYLGLAFASAPLGWLVLHIVFSFHYARLFYLSCLAGETGPASGLIFPGTRDPGPWDFLYYSFVVGMTAQVSDVQVTTTKMRQLTLLHGIVSFMFNTVLIALAVNTIVTLVQAT